MKSYYKILGVPEYAPPDEIKKAYKQLVLKYHPDRNSAPEAVKKFEEVDEAYKTLSDREKKRVYDIMLAEALTERRAEYLKQIWAEFF